MYMVAVENVTGDLDIANEGTGIAHFTGACQVIPLSVEQVTKRAPCQRLKLFQETYMRPKRETLDCCRTSQTRGRLAAVCECKMRQCPVTPPSVDFHTPTPCPPPPAVETNCSESAGRFVVESNRVAKVCHRAIGNGLGLRRVKVVPPSLEYDAPE